MTGLVGGGVVREGYRIDPVSLAGLLGQSAPTAEQAAIIAGPLEPTVVIAGAGSGKSETMAARVVWLVANGLVRPDRVLGLTFTRKAAAELATRVRTRLGQLRATGFLGSAETAAVAGDPGEPAAASLLDAEPIVSTYHSYAARLVGDHALREAMEPTMRLITPAVEWQLASGVVAAYDGPMDHVEMTPASVTKAVLDLAGELSEHLRGPDDVRRVGAWLRERRDALPKVLAPVRQIIAKHDAREQLLPMVERYRALRAAREVMDHGDQVALAARIASRHPEVGAIERSRYSVVLLDEYQDTSHAQLVLLRALFGVGAAGGVGHPVTAVGDPCQSIYGWRGASAGNLLRFRQDFPARRGHPARLAKLATSFRNGEYILGAANALSHDLRADAPELPVLESSTARDERGRVVCALFDTAESEAGWLADEIAAALAVREGVAPDGGPWPDSALHPSDVAILCRKRAQFPAIRQALEERGVPVEVVGLGGLLTVPEVADIVATLRVMHDPTSGDALVRLLTGPRWRLGPRDLVALGRRARELAKDTRRDVDLPDGAPEPAPDDALRQVITDLAAESGSLIDALDDLGEPARYSATGFGRMARLAAEVRGLREQVGQPLPDLVTEVERVIGLDVEVAARPGAEAASARADLDAFADAAARFAGSAEEPTLGAFLAYLNAAEDQEFGLEAGRIGDTDSVKLMTVHAAKGLQWPVVAVPGLSAGKSAQVFPARPTVSTKWTTNPRALPFPLRGDVADLPALRDLDPASREAFDEACLLREEREERRLAYVAVTRASYLLLASGYWWGATGSTRMGPSVFLREIHAVCEAHPRHPGYAIAHWTPEPPEEATNPLLAEPPSAPWPPAATASGEGTPAGASGPATLFGVENLEAAAAAPGGARHSAVVEGARLVSAALEGAAESWLHASDDVPLDDADRSRPAGWELDERLLLAERAAHRRTNGHDVELPAHLSVSTLVAMARDAGEVARRIRRPMPRPPAPHLRRGTAFHRWLEQEYGQQRLLDTDELPGAADDEAAADTDLDALRAAFTASAWADRVPIEVEVPFETRLADRLIRGRIDAVFREPDGSYTVVDWKTGRPPRDEAESRVVAVQLAAYRLAWSRLMAVGVDRVSAAFHYVKANTTIRPTDLLDESALERLITAIPERSP
ncbi:MAG TPA: ATP-dependent DNA helicase [Streptosporangiaceae bacterium]|jgi:DNA helicase-2/ATP-dependent DNA helicase PcrA